MSDRDELVTAIMHHPWLDGAAGQWFEGYCPECQRTIAGGYNSPSHAAHLAEAILAAGYRKPRTITTAEELDALPVGAVVLSASYHSDVDGTAISFQRWYDGDWHRGARSGSTHPDNFLPATVLYEPEEPQP